jgi:formimidoylglutamate deiminase
VASKLDPKFDLDAGRAPGLPNLHSHAFQRAMAGLTERRGSQADSFWTWREQMYRFVERLTPDDLEAIAAYAYMEMLEAGFTWVAEFHYLHHQPDGRPYDNIAEMSERIVAAASQTGIGLTLLPVFYRQGGFGGQPATPAQRRFLNDRDSYARLMETKVPGGRIGIAPHSLRALALEDLKWAAETWRGQPAHIHVSEQTREVEDCLAAHGRRPIDLLMDTVPVDKHWCLVHATHADQHERTRIAKAGAVVGLCPITEANLGDGLFDVPDFLAQGGRFGVGSDSNVRISAADELRTLEYGQRLIHRQRNVLGEASRSTGRRLFDAALAGGAQAAGATDDAVVMLDTASHHGDAIVDHWLFSADNAAIMSVERAGVRLVDGGRHKHRERLAARYRKALARLLS